MAKIEKFPKQIKLAPPKGCETEVYNGRLATQAGLLVALRDAPSMIAKGWRFLKKSDADLVDSFTKAEEKRLAKETTKEPAPPAKPAAAPPTSTPEGGKE